MLRQGITAEVNRQDGRNDEGRRVAICAGRNGPS
jgi:hypothetical protein